MALFRRCGFLVSLYVFGDALQMNDISGAKRLDLDLISFVLDEKEVRERGSHCLNGQIPHFYFGEGSEKTKWIFWLHGGGYCTNEEECLDYTNEVEWETQADSKPLQKFGEFSNYNRVYIKNCDLGVFMGDRDEPVTYQGKTLYFQGSRILTHVVDTLAKNYTMEHVLVAGGSGGGHSLFLVADHFKSILPKTVTKYAVAPINGWYVSEMDSLKDMYKLIKPEKVIPKACKGAFASSEEYKCLAPEVAYQHTQSSTFMTQIADYTLSWGCSDGVSSAYKRCLTPDLTPEDCTAQDVALVQGYLDNYTALLQSYDRYRKHGEGGYLSTCTVHTFYNEDDMFSAYENNGVTAGDAIAAWWSNLDDRKSPAQWYLPCQLGDENHAQCEQSCGSFYMDSSLGMVTKDMETWRGL